MKLRYLKKLDKGYIKTINFLGSLLSMAFNMIEPALPKIANTIGVSGLSAGVSHGINKALNKKEDFRNWWKNNESD